MRIKTSQPRVIVSGQKVDHSLTYRDVSFRKTEIGRIPSDIFLSTEQTPPLDSLKKSRPVVVQQPEMSHGEPVVRETTRRFQGEAPNAIVKGAVGGAIGGVVGAVLSGFPMVLSGSAAWLAGGAAVGAAVGGFLSYNSAASKEVQLVVQEKSIVSQEMTGIETRVSPGSLKGRQGFYHSFSPALQSTQHGTYDVPKLQLSRKADS